MSSLGRFAEDGRQAPGVQDAQRPNKSLDAPRFVSEVVEKHSQERPRHPADPLRVPASNPEAQVARQTVEQTMLLFQAFDGARDFRLEVPEGREKGSFRIPQVLREPSDEPVGDSVKGFLGHAGRAFVGAPPEAS